MGANEKALTMCGIFGVHVCPPLVRRCPSSFFFIRLGDLRVLRDGPHENLRTAAASSAFSCGKDLLSWHPPSRLHEQSPAERVVITVWSLGVEWSSVFLLFTTQCPVLGLWLPYTHNLGCPTLLYVQYISIIDMKNASKYLNAGNSTQKTR